MSSGPKVGIDTGSRPRGGRSGIELLAVMLLGIATVATAWCGVQSSKWNGRETDEARIAGLARIESSRLSAVAAQRVAYDAQVTAQFAAAVAGRNEALQTFIRDNLVRPDYQPRLDRWLADVRAGTAGTENLFENEEYLAEQAAPAQEAAGESDAAMRRADEASKNGDDYLVVTLMTASALFFAGVTTSFSGRMPRLLLVALAAGTLVLVAAVLAGLPVA
jgi:hypothetical protein